MRGTVQQGVAGVLIAVLSLCAAGCGGGGPSGGNEQEARETLVKVLDAWKSGRTADDMRHEDPEVIVGDSDWKTGRRLNAYQIDSGMFDGENLRVPVTLVLENRQHRRRKVVVNYIFGTQPVVTLFRDEE
jgi:hypothetical protein